MGMISTLAVHAMSMLDRTDEVMIYDGGLRELVSRHGSQRTLVVDVDGFRVINDGLGTASGDALLFALERPEA